jgi:hypothetical protein
LCGLDVPLLAFLGPAANQNDQAVAVLAEVDAIAGTEVDLVFENSRAGGRGGRSSLNYGNAYVTNCQWMGRAVPGKKTWAADERR